MTSKLNETLERGRARALELETRLADIVAPILDSHGRKAARNFRRHVLDPLTASVTAAAGSPDQIAAAMRKEEQRRRELSAALRGEDDDLIRLAKQRLKDARARLFELSGQLPDPHWRAPMPDQLVDVKGLVQALRGKTDPVRLALIEAVARETVEEAGIAWDISNPFIANALASTASQIVNIADTTRAQVAAIIAESYDLGLSIPDTARAIQAGMRAATPARAVLIARTEMTGATSAGSLAAVQMVDSVSGGGHLKRWAVAPGAKYPRHENYPDLGGQTVALDAYFEVGDAQLQFPSDPSGPPEECCNCLAAARWSTSSLRAGKFPTSGTRAACSAPSPVTFTLN